MPTTRSASPTSRSSLAYPEEAGSVSTPDVQPAGLAVWWLAIRPRTLGAGLVPVAVGLAVASRAGAIDVPVALVTLVAALLLQIATNLANDYFDARSGVDDVDRLGPVRVTQAGLASPRAVMRALVAVVGLALACGVYLVAHGGLPILVVGALSVLTAIAYSAGPWPLSWYGLGDLLAFTFFGVVAVCGTYFLQRHALHGAAIAASLPVGCLVTALIVVNNLRDIPSDRRSGKRTLAVRIGERGTRLEYASLVVVAYVLTAALALVTSPAVGAVALTVPVAVNEVRRLQQRDGAELNLSLAGTARLHLLFGSLLTLGLAV